MQTHDRSMLEAERALLETDHAEIGTLLARSWYLPEKLIEPISFHHDVAASTNHQMKTAVVHLADILVKGSGFGYSGDDIVPVIQDAAWRKLALTDEILVEIIEELEEKLAEAKNFSLERQGNDGNSD